jgi:hypothetical protein
MVTTRGYRDIVHIGRHQRPQNYSIQQEIPWQDRVLVQRGIAKSSASAASRRMARSSSHSMRTRSASLPES